MPMLANCDPMGYCAYPDSNKISYWTTPPTRRTTSAIRRQESVDYYDGEL